MFEDDRDVGIVVVAGVMDGMGRMKLTTKIDLPRHSDWSVHGGECSNCPTNFLHRFRVLNP